MITELNVPIEVTALLCAAFFAAGTFARRAFAHRRLAGSHSPLADVVKPPVPGNTVDLAAHRNSRRAASDAVLHGRIDHCAAQRRLANDFDPEQMNNQIAAVLRAGLRRSDRVAHVDGEGFTIIIPGADERVATRIADRLRASLAQLRTPHGVQSAKVTASFGVAAGRNDDNGERLMRQARRALNIALSQGHGRVVTASEYEEVLYLPAPAAQPATVAA